MTGELDRIGLEPQGALWTYSHSLRDWRFCVISDLVTDLGRPAVYDLLGQALDRIGPVDGLTIFDVHLYEPSEIVPVVLGGAVHVGGISRARLENCTVDGIRFDALIYRLTRARPVVSRRKAAKAFRSRVAELA